MRKPTNLKFRIAVAFIFVSLLIIAPIIKAQQITIRFNDRDGLLGMPGELKASPFTYANYYREAGMLFMDAVHPSDPELTPLPGGHFHLNYQDESIVDKLVGSKLVFGRETPNGFVPVIPENEDRTLTPFHIPGGVVQMIYDPDNNYDPNTGEGADPFNLISLVVHRGKLNVGVKSPDFGIGVYNNLTAGYRWFLIDANNLTRATFEYPASFGPGLFVVDEIVFEPITPPPFTTTKPKPTNKIKILTDQEDSTKLKNIDYASNDAILLESLNREVRTFGAVDVNKANVKIQGEGKDEFLVEGTMELSDQSNGVDMSYYESVVLAFGTYRESIPAFLFKCNNGEMKKCYYNGSLGGITNMVIVVRKNKVQFLITAKDLNLGGMSKDSPVPFSLQIGDDLGVGRAQVHYEMVTTSSEKDKASIIPKAEANSTGLKATVYPNPAFNAINIKLENTKGNSVVELINNLGNTIARKNMNSKTVVYTSFDVSKLATGIYWIRVTAGDKQTIQKVAIGQK